MFFDKVNICKYYTLFKNRFGESLMADNIYKVKLLSVFDPSIRVTFETTPTVTESGSVEYSPVNPVHMPGSIQVYRHTPSRNFTINARFISRTSAEATKNKNYVQTLRGWRYPWFGAGSSTLQPRNVQARSQRDQLQTKLQQSTISGQEHLTSQQQSNITQQISLLDVGVEMLGAPPEILYLYGYSSTAQDARGVGAINLNRIPVVMSSLDINFPEDVDYLPCSDNKTPFPVKMEVSISLLETHSPAEYARFSLEAYKKGNLNNF